MAEKELDPTLVDDYLGIGEGPNGWMDRIKTLRMHKLNAKFGGYDEETGDKLYFDNITKFRSLTNEFGFIRAQKQDDAILRYYEGWNPDHFKQLLIQLGEWKDE